MLNIIIEHKLDQKRHDLSVEQYKKIAEQMRAKDKIREAARQIYIKKHFEPFTWTGIVAEDMAAVALIGGFEQLLYVLRLARNATAADVRAIVFNTPPQLIIDRCRAIVLRLADDTLREKLTRI